MENERKKKFQDYAPPEQKPSGGYNLNGVYYSRDGQRLDDQPKKSWSQREYERAEREKIHCRAKREQRESEVDAQGNPVKDNSGVKKVIAIVVIVLGVVAIFGIVGMYLKSDNGAVGLIREAIQTIRDDDSSHPSENFHNDAEADSKSKTPDGKFKNLNGENVSYVHGFNTFALAGNEFSIPCKFSCNLLEYLTQRDIQTKNSGVNVRYRGKHRFFKGFNEFIKEKTRRCDNDFEKIERHVFF